jgi:hypothetical protein
MKRLLLSALVIACHVNAFGQGSVNFNNRVVTPGTGAQSPLTAPIYGADPAAPLLEKSGQTATGVPAGTQSYAGPLLAGTGFTVQLWGGPAGTAADQLMLAQNGSTTFRTGGGAGYVVALANTAVIPGVPSAPGVHATLQIRVWDNLGGTITTWAQAIDPANSALVAHGASPLFTPDFDLGGGSVLPPNLIGLQSFQLTIVPEPSVIALGALGLGALLLRRRKS